MAAFIKSLFIGFAILGVTAVALSKLLPNYSLSHALVGLLLMALNALAAVILFDLGKRGNLIRTSLASMSVRFLTLAAIMIVGLELFKPTRTELLSFICTAFAAYVAFQALEIRHFIRMQARLVR